MCSAAPLAWQFTYTGFFDELAGRFNPEQVIRGEFTGEDRNGDGAIDFDELATMLIYGERNYKGCQGEETPYFACGVGPFHFGPGNDLSFSLGIEFHDRPRLNGAGHTIDTGDKAEAATVVDIFNMAAAGHSYAAIAKELNGRGVKPFRNKKNPDALWITA